MGHLLRGKEVQLTSRRCSFYRTPEEAAIDKDAQAAYLLVAESNAYSKKRIMPNLAVYSRFTCLNLQVFTTFKVK